MKLKTSSGKVLSTSRGLSAGSSDADNFLDPADKPRDVELKEFEKSPFKTIAILGAGSWGTAVAIHLANCSHQIMLWGHNPQHVNAMLQDHSNERYLPGITFPPTLTPISDLNHCLNQAEYTIIAVPSHAFANLIEKINTKPMHLAWLTKGIDPKSQRLLSDLVIKKWGDSLPFAVISGPSFAREVAQNLPTAMVVAGNNSHFAQTLRTIFHQHNMRIYLSDDFVGVQLCGAVKNVLAIACGISDGLNYGANARAALITRGLAEMQRLGASFGAKSDTFMGLAGVGDLILTCTDNQSRNRRYGMLLGKGLELLDAEQQIGQVVEGKYNAEQICNLASQYHIEIPICQEVHAVLTGQISPEQAVTNLMQRPPRN